MHAGQIMSPGSPAMPTDNSDLYILTVAHMIVSNGPSISSQRFHVKYYERSTMEPRFGVARVFSYSFRTDICLMTFEPAFQPAEVIRGIVLETPNALKAGIAIAVIGNPLAWDEFSLSVGHVREGFDSSATTYSGTDARVSSHIPMSFLIQAAIAGGNSGGGVFATRTRRMLGLVSWGPTAASNNTTGIAGAVHPLILVTILQNMLRKVRDEGATVPHRYVLGFMRLNGRYTTAATFRILTVDNYTVRNAAGLWQWDSGTAGDGVSWTESDIGQQTLNALSLIHSVEIRGQVYRISDGGVTIQGGAKIPFDFVFGLCSPGEQITLHAYARQDQTLADSNNAVTVRKTLEPMPSGVDTMFTGTL